MQIEVAILISGISLAFGVYQGISNMKRSKSKDDKEEASSLTTVIVKLENINAGIVRIEADLSNLRTDFKEDHERLVQLESMCKLLENRVCRIEKSIGGEKE